jgi:hypothetical protein
MSESLVGFISAVGAGIAAGVVSSGAIYIIERRKMKLSMIEALEVETYRNLQITQLNATFEIESKRISEEESQRMLFTPFHCDVWGSIINHGLLREIDKDAVKDLVETYNLIREVNAIILAALSSQENVASLPVVFNHPTNEDFSEIHLSTLILQDSRILNEKLIDLRTELGFREKTEESTEHERRWSDFLKRIVSKWSVKRNAST